MTLRVIDFGIQIAFVMIIVMTMAHSMWYNYDYVPSAKIMMTMPVKIINRQARHDLLEKYRPRILMTEAELAEDAVRMMIPRYPDTQMITGS